MTQPLFQDENRGYFRLFDGQIVYIQSVQYSYDGIYWEDGDFQPNTHINSVTGIGTLPGHKYRRVRHSGDTKWQLPEYIVATDGREVEIGINGEYLSQRYVGDTDWTNICLLSTLKGDKGDKGETGSGIVINAIGAFDKKPLYTSSTPFRYESIGNHILTSTEDTGFFHSQDGTTWVEYGAQYEGLVVKYWHGEDDGTGSYGVLGGNIVPWSTGDTLDNSTGYIYTLYNGTWTKGNSIAQPTGQVKVNASDVLDYLNSKFNTTYFTESSSKITIKDSSITADKFDESSFSSGLTNDGSSVIVDTNGLSGNGIKKSDATNTFEIDIPTLITTGLQQVGSKIGVKTSELIDVNEQDGLTTSLGILKVKPNTSMGIQLTSDGVAVKSDGTEGITAGTNGIRIKDTGVSGKHLNTTTVDGTTLQYDTSIKQIKVKTGGIGSDQLAASSVTLDKLTTTATSGDILYFNGTTWTKLNIGTTDQILRVDNTGKPIWDDEQVSQSYTGGTGISITQGNVINNDSPDQTVNMTAGIGISITENYPDFTVALGEVGNVKFTSTGLQLKDEDEVYWKLVVDTSGNLSTEVP